MDVTLFRIYLLLPGLGNKVGEVWGGVWEDEGLFPESG